MIDTRYMRQIGVQGIGYEGQRLLVNSQVAVIGVGGLGCTVSHLLCAGGVGSLILIDPDVVDISNLHRQLLFTENDVGKAKALSAQQKLMHINSTVSVTAHVEALSVESCQHLVGTVDVVIDAADSLFVSYILSDYCHAHRLPLVSASVISTYGYLALYCFNGAHRIPTLRAVFNALPMDVQNCQNSNVTGPSVAAIGAIQAQLAMQVLTGTAVTFKGELLIWDLWAYHCDKIGFAHVSEMEDPVLIISRQQIDTNAVLLDVRSAHEIALKPVEKSINIPHDSLIHFLHRLPKNRQIACFCNTGQRALYAAQMLRENHFDSVVFGL